MDIETLARVQFGLTAGFHIIFPALLIGLSAFLTFLYWRWLRSNDEVYLDAYTLWLNILIVAYVLGVITGVALSAQLDNIFSGFYRQTESALVPIRRYELLFATLLEGGCIGVMLFERRKKRSYFRFAATLLFTFGIFLTAFFVVSRNSWMNTPTGVEWSEGKALVLDHWQVVFNPSFPLRYLHMITAGMAATAFVVLGLSAYRYLRKGSNAVTQKSIMLGLNAAFLCSIAQFLIGHFHGDDVFTNQPIKFAAMEGQWETERGAAFRVFAIPDMNEEQNRYALEIPKGLSMLIKFDANSEIRGLKDVPPQDRPNVMIVFYSFRIMLAMALLMLLTVTIGMWLKTKAGVESSKWFLRSAALMTPSGLVAVIAGWVVAEAGRQPWVVYGHIRTTHVISVVSSDQLLASMTIFVLAYVALGVVGVALFRLILLKHGPLY